MLENVEKLFWEGVQHARKVKLSMMFISKTETD